MDKERYRLYIWMRTDLDSLNAGKAMAQAAHAANMAHFDMNGLNDYEEAWRLWAGDRGFGTTVVFEAHHKPKDIVDIIQSEYMNGGAVLAFGVVNDPTYPLKDGKVTHFIPVDTCAYAFVDLIELDGKSLTDSLIGASQLHK